MRGDGDSVEKVKEMFANWSKRNTRFARRSLLYPDPDSDVDHCFLDTCTLATDVDNINVQNISLYTC